MNSENNDSQNTRQQWQRLVHKYKTSGADIVSYLLFFIILDSECNEELLV